jgi:hypothetical protein
VERGLRCADGLLVVIDGGKGLHKSVEKVLASTTPSAPSSCRRTASARAASSRSSARATPCSAWSATSPPVRRRCGPGRSSGDRSLSSRFQSIVKAFPTAAGPASVSWASPSISWPRWRGSNDPARRYLVNFTRRAIFGAGGGHHSPIGGYLEAEDLVFVLDVNRDFQPWLVERSRLFAAMDTDDGDQKRGLLLIE